MERSRQARTHSEPVLPFDPMTQIGRLPLLLLEDGVGGGGDACWSASAAAKEGEIGKIRFIPIAAMDLTESMIIDLRLFLLLSMSLQLLQADVVVAVSVVAGPLEVPSDGWQFFFLLVA